LSREIDGLDWIAGYFGERELLKFPLINPDNLRDIFQRVTRREIFNVARELFKPRNANLVVITKNPSSRLKADLLRALTF
jgi:predicted Zn-dependent peptidase